MRKLAIPFLFSLTVLAIAQQKHAAPTHATASAKSSASATNLPSEDEINGFLH